MEKLRLFIMVIAGVALTGGVKAQNCPNIDFSDGEFVNWQCYTGDCRNGAINKIPVPTSVANRHVALEADSLMSAGSLYDEFCSLLKKVPDGYTHSAKIGNNSSGAEMEAIEYTFTVDSNSCLLMLSFAWVMQNPGHGASDQPQFSMTVKDTFDDVITELPCSHVNFISGNTNTSLLSCSNGNAQVAGWKTVGFNLEQLIGQTIKVYFEIRDCTLGGHYGYAYVVCECRPMRIELQFCQNSTSALLTAPDGFAKYKWTRVSDTSWSSSAQQVSVQSTDGEIFDCFLTSSVEDSCSASIQTEVKKTYIFPDFFYGIDSGGGVPYPTPLVNKYDTCARTVTFVDLSTTINCPKKTVRWNISAPGEGQYEGFDSLFTLTFANPSDTPVRYLILQTVITENDCEATSDSVFITIYPKPVVDIITPKLLCAGDVDTLRAHTVRSKIIQFTWNNTAVGLINDSTLLINTPGIYILKAKNEFGCITYDTVTVEQAPMPHLALDSVQGALCRSKNGGAWLHVESGSQPFLFWWDNNLDDTLTLPVKSHLETGTHIVKVQDSNSCVASLTVNVPFISIINLVLDSVQGELCNKKDGVAWLHVENGNQPFFFWWDDNWNDTIGLPVKPNLEVGTHVVKVQDSIGCVDSLTVEVPFIPGSSLVLDSVRGELCHKKDGVIWLHVENENQPFLFWWDDNLNDTLRFPVKSYLETGIHIVKMQDGKGCIDSLMVDVPFILGPKADFTTHSYIVFTSNEFVLKDISTGSVIQGDWDFDDGATEMTIGSEKTVYHTYSDKGEYVVSLLVTDKNGCTDTVSKVIKVYEDLNVYIPNTFTPNGDGLNDTWKPIMKGYREDGYLLNVYDRWGQIIFHTTDPNEAWDGTIHGQAAESNSLFSYILKVRNMIAHEFEYIGRLTAIR